MTCLNCHTGLPDGAHLCPHCDATVPPLPVLGVGRPQPIKGKEWGGFSFGLFLGLMSPLLWGVGFPIMLLLYFSERKYHSPFSRGLGWGLVLVVVLGAGALAVCTYVSSQPYHPAAKGAKP